MTLMKQQGRLYGVCGLLLLATVLYLNLYGGGGEFHLGLPFPWLQPPMAFVLRNSTHFVLSSSSPSHGPLYLNGWNSYWMLAAASLSSSRAHVPEMLRRGRRMGLSVCRTWAFSDGGGPSALQISPGRFNEAVFQALDYVIYEARRNGVWLILSLVNNLRNYGGKARYVQWARAAGVNVSTDDDFFSHPTVKAYYQAYVKAILTRKNSYSGIRYSEESAIFAWELINEPRCASSSSAPVLQAWIAEMAAYIKSLDNKHLVTVGLEGFYGPTRSNRLSVNPGEWAASLGSDFIQNSATEHVDFASVHVYPDNWIPKASFEEKARYLADWVDIHVNDSANVLKKPVLFTEVGSYLHIKKKGLYERDLLLKIIYDKIYESAKSGGAAAGALIWQLMVEGMQQQSDAFSLVARDNPATRGLMVQQSCRLNRLSRKKMSKDVFLCDGIR